jgi:hypothetical protein
MMKYFSIHHSLFDIRCFLSLIAAYGEVGFHLSIRGLIALTVLENFVNKHDVVGLNTLSYPDIFVYTLP